MTITACTVQQDGELYTLSVTADGYLYNMVRILAGTVLQAGLGKMNPGRCARSAAKQEPRPGLTRCPPGGCFCGMCSTRI